MRKRWRRFIERLRANFKEFLEVFEGLPPRRIIFALLLMPLMISLYTIERIAEKIIWEWELSQRLGLLLCKLSPLPEDQEVPKDGTAV